MPSLSLPTHKVVTSIFPTGTIGKMLGGSCLNMPSTQCVVRPGENCRSSQTPFSELLGESSGVCGSYFNARIHVTLGRSSTSCFLFCKGMAPALVGPCSSMFRYRQRSGHPRYTSQACVARRCLNLTESWGDGSVVKVQEPGVLRTCVKMLNTTSDSEVGRQNPYSSLAEQSS